MLQLSRTVRFYLAQPVATDDTSPPPAHRNGYAGWPGPRGLAGYFELLIQCQGDADPITGYFINIKHIDTAVREHALPAVHKLVESAGGATNVALGDLLRCVIHAIDPALANSVKTVQLHLSRYHQISMDKINMSQFTLRQQYEFSAAHRLHVPGLSDEKNREIFGKCNNPSGHGHNYQLEVAVTGDVNDAGHALAVDALDRVVHEHVLEVLDHKHLNVGVPAFAGLNPSVENIAKVIYDMLENPVQALSVTLAEVSVWETPKTVCTYQGVKSPMSQSS